MYYILSTEDGGRGFARFVNETGVCHCHARDLLFVKSNRDHVQRRVQVSGV